MGSRRIWGSEAEFQNSLLGKGRILVLMTLRIRVQARCLNQSAGWVSEVKFDTQVMPVWGQVSMRVWRSGLWLLGALTGGP